MGIAEPFSLATTHFEPPPETLNDCEHNLESPPESEVEASLFDDDGFSINGDGARVIASQ
jgi:hypothetical protein